MDFSIPDSALAGITPDNGKKQKPVRKGPDPRVLKTPLNAHNEFTYKAKLRLLYKQGSPAAIVKVMRHYFSDPIAGSTDANGKQKYWTTNALCPKSIGEKCPICDNAWDNDKLFKSSGDKKFEKIKKDRLPTTSFLTNVYVMKDEQVPENEGQVKAWFMSNGVHKKIQNLMFPKSVEIDDDEFGGDAVTRIVPFHPIEGANMMLIANHDDKGWVSYENTKFGKQTPLATADDPADAEKAISAILEQCHDLDDWVGKEKFLSQDELTQKLNTHLERTGMSDVEGTINVVAGASSGPGMEIPESHKKSNTVKSGDSEAFFAEEALDDDEFSMPASPPASSGAPAASVASIEDDDDDDLPF